MFTKKFYRGRYGNGRIRKIFMACTGLYGKFIRRDFTGRKWMDVKSDERSFSFIIKEEQ